MRNLVNVVNLTEEDENEPASTPFQRIPRQVRSVGEREYVRRVREAGKRERSLLLKVARAQKAQGV